MDERDHEQRNDHDHEQWSDHDHDRDHDRDNDRDHDRDESHRSVKSKDEVTAVMIATTETTNEENDAIASSSFAARCAARVSRHPYRFLGASFVVVAVASVSGMVLGGFDASVNNTGWQTRGTLVANRHTQIMLVNRNARRLFRDDDNDNDDDDEEAWEDLLNNVQPGWESDDDRRRRRLSSLDEAEDRSLNKRGTGVDVDQDDNATWSYPIPTDGVFEGCNPGEFYYYLNSVIRGWSSWSQLWAMWKASENGASLTRADLLTDLCRAEERTQAALEREDLCSRRCGAGGRTCFPPISLVLHARFAVDGGAAMDCEELGRAWESTGARARTERALATCVRDVKNDLDPNDPFATLDEPPSSCLLGFSPSLVEADLDETSIVAITASIFDTDASAEELYRRRGVFHRGTSRAVRGAYDTRGGDFNYLFTESVLGRDMALACGSAIVTSLAIWAHTRSLFLTVVGLFQIVLSFPVAYCVYTFVGGLKFFPFLNFIGVFVVFALGADDIFVAVDKWRNARLDAPPEATTEFVATRALPDAAQAMLLTTLTTAAAFFGTAMCPVAPIRMFAVFCGLLVVFDYCLCVLLVFPALCAWDRRRQGRRAEGRRGCCDRRCENRNDTADDANSDDYVPPIRRVLSAFYRVLHFCRWGLAIVSVAAFVACALAASKISLPQSNEVRLLSESNEFERHYQWREKMLDRHLADVGGSNTHVAFGLVPADTGDRNDPDSWSQLVLDPTFDPSSTDAQRFMLSFCPRLYQQDFAKPVDEYYVCPFNAFDEWLARRSVSNRTVAGYDDHCAGAKGVPVSPDLFHACMIAYAQDANDQRVLSYRNKIRIVRSKFQSRVRYTDPYETLDAEWRLIEAWMTTTTTTSNSTTTRPFFSSFAFLWYDTNGRMLSTAFGATGVALGAAAIVVLVDSRSLVLTAFAAVTIAYVLVSVTAALIAAGWSLGFLESICFAILIGVSVDFVIHFCHAYSSADDVDERGRSVVFAVARGERTKRALIRMGPSVLAAAATTMAAAVAMLFCEITFFQKFALVLFMTVVQASIGSFVIFLTLTDCFGPSDPTLLARRVSLWCGSRAAATAKGETGG